MKRKTEAKQPLVSAAYERRPDAVIFDWDNTLVDTWEVIQDAMNVTLTAYGLEPWTLAETRARVRRSMRDSFPEMFGDLWREAGECFYRRYETVHLEKLKARPGAGDMLREISAAGIYLGVVSNKLGKYLRDEVRHLGWEDLFGRIVGAFDAPRDKPAVEPVEMALAGSGIARGPKVWFVGDTEIDLECAIAAGCRPVLLRETPPDSKEFRKFPPERHVDGCQALCKLLLSL